MIKNIIFDLAGVIINLDIERDTKALDSVGLPNFYEFPKHPEICKPTIAYLDGLLGEKEFVKELKPLCKAGVTDEDILWSMDAVLDIIPLERLKLLVELRKHYKVYLLSNIYVRGWQIALEQFAKQGFSTSDCFDKLFLSYEMQLAKPDPRIYQAVMDEAGIVPEETIYFDDSAANIEAASKLGIQSRLVKMNCLEECLNELNY